MSQMAKTNPESKIKTIRNAINVYRKSLKENTYQAQIVLKKTTRNAINVSPTSPVKKKKITRKIN